MVELGRREQAVLKALPYLVSLAAGVLLATACLDILPEAVRAAGNGMGVWDLLLLSLLALFFVQVLARALEANPADPVPSDAHVESAGGEPSHSHHHEHALRSAKRSRGTLLLGAGLHSVVDGVAIAAAFAAGRGTGWSAALAVGLHEMPHRLGDFA